MRLIQKVGAWLDQRLKLGASIRETAEHPVPRETASWFYVFGSAALTCFILQIVTGILLALIYVPSARRSLEQPADPQSQHLARLVHSRVAWLGLEFHGCDCSDPHGAGFSFRRIQVSARADLDCGRLLLLMTLGMAFTGQVLRFDQDAYWGLGIGASIASRVPVVGPWAVNLMLGGPIIAGATLSRFFALHVFVIPGLLIAFVGRASAHGAEAGNQ